MFYLAYRPRKRMPFTVAGSPAWIGQPSSE
jgi:hypothetical protein